MIKRTLEISRQAAHISIRNHQLLVTPRDGGTGNSRSFPCEDIGLVCVDNPGTTYSHRALVELMNDGAVLVFCGGSHLPTGMALPTSTHPDATRRLYDQIALTVPRRKQLWKQIIQAKVRAQAVNLESFACKRRLQAVARRVRSGDVQNAEAQAAKYYWANFLGNKDRFRRDKDGADPLNSMLNYGYAIVRAAVARTLVSGGFAPALGIHHRHRSNPFCLADDLLEPLRPLVDARARELFRAGHDHLTSETKRALLEVLSLPVRVNGEVGPLGVVLHRTVASLARCMTVKSEKLVLPDATNSTMTEQTGGKNLAPAGDTLGRIK